MTRTVPTAIVAVLKAGGEAGENGVEDVGEVEKFSRKFRRRELQLARGGFWGGMGGMAGQRLIGEGQPLVRTRNNLHLQLAGSNSNYRCKRRNTFLSEHAIRDMHL